MGLGRSRGGAGGGGGQPSHLLPAQTRSGSPSLSPRIWGGHPEAQHHVPRVLSSASEGSGAGSLARAPSVPWHGGAAPVVIPASLGCVRSTHPHLHRCPASQASGTGCPSAHSKPARPGAPRALTQQRGAPVPQREALVAGDAEGRQGVEAPLQQRLQARGRRVRRVEQVVDLLAGGPQLENWRGGAGGWCRGCS